MAEEGTSSEALSHTEFASFFQESLKALIKIDPILSDLHPQVTLEEVENLLALEHGHAITVYVECSSRSPWKIVVPKETTLHRFKIALKRHVNLYLSRNKKFKKISWKYIWRTYWLCYYGTKLVDDNKKLLHYGISNKTCLTFSKKLRMKS